MIYINKKSNNSFSILLEGYIFSLGFYFIWCFYFFQEKPYTYDSLLLIASVVFAITGLYLFLLFLFRYIKSFRNVWTSFLIVSIITLLIFFLIPSANNLIYGMYYYNKYNLKGDETIKTIEKNEAERKIMEATNIKTKNQLEDTKEKIQTVQKRMKEIEYNLNNSLEINDVANTSIQELQAKLESERKENNKSKDEIILALRSKRKEERKVEEHIILKGKSKRDSSEIKINSNVDNTDSDLIRKEPIFKVQIISSDTPLAIDSPKLKGLKNVWEYKDGGLYKYTVGNEKDLKSASALQSESRRKGFTDAFVVAFKNGKRIPVREARKLLN